MSVIRMGSFFLGAGERAWRGPGPRARVLAVAWQRSPAMEASYKSESESEAWPGTQRPGTGTVSAAVREHLRKLCLREFPCGAGSWVRAPGLGLWGPGPAAGRHGPGRAGRAGPWGLGSAHSGGRQRGGGWGSRVKVGTGPWALPGGRRAGPVLSTSDDLGRGLSLTRCQHPRFPVGRFLWGEKLLFWAKSATTFPSLRAFNESLRQCETWL